MWRRQVTEDCWKVKLIVGNGSCRAGCFVGVIQIATMLRLM